MPKKLIGDVHIAFEEFGDASDPVMLLIPGLGSSLAVWPDTFVQQLVQQNYRVIALDNRDSGQSQVMSQDAPSKFAWQIFKFQFGLKPKAPYSLSDMSDDAAGLLDALSIDSAHIIGMSMGGMIAQNLVIRHPHKVRTLTSIMSTTNNRSLPKSSSKITNHMLKAPKTDDRETNLRHMMKSWQLFAGQGYPGDNEHRRAYVEKMFDRGISKAGGARQTLAILAEPDRRAKLGAIKIPVLVIHGNDDKLLPVACGIDTAKSIPNAQLEVIEGMGHDMPEELIGQISELVVRHTRTNAA